MARRNGNFISAVTRGGRDGKRRPIVNRGNGVVSTKVCVVFILTMNQTHRDVSFEFIVLD